MNIKTKTYRYAKVIKGIGHYGKVKIEVKYSSTSPKVSDKCVWHWKTKEIPNFLELDILKTWRKSAFDSATYIIENYQLPDLICITIADINGTYIDTSPASISATVIIGIFDLCQIPLSTNDLIQIDDFVVNNTEINTPVNFSNLILEKPKRIN